MKIVLGADHGGFDVKEALLAELRRRGVEAEDLGCHGRESVDYPDYAAKVASRVSSGEVRQGILVCTTGIGMAITANKFPRVRAALCITPEMAVKARTHNDANVLVLGGGMISAGQAIEILDAWLTNPFSDLDRHARRVRKIEATSRPTAALPDLLAQDPEIHAAIRAEEARQATTVNLIASENYTSRAVMDAQGCVMTNKYAEGYPGKRWYSGCDNVDTAEQLAIDRAKSLFGCEHVNVQSHCGSSANMAVYFAALRPGDTIMAMSLDQGGHLTHGHRINFSGRFYHVVSYGVSPRDERIDYDDLAAKAREHKPRLIVAGASAYSRTLEFERFREIADGVGAMLMVDMAHIAGLVAGGAHPSPVPHAQYVTSTTHKTLRGPRGGLILCRTPFASEIDREVFPGTQGGQLMHTIAAKAVCFREAMLPSFRLYAEQIVRNARALAERLAQKDFRIVSGGTDNHLFLLDLSAQDLTGRDAAAALDRAGMIVNKNAIPFDRQSAFVTSGIRIGTPAVTTRGMREPEMHQIADWISAILRDPADPRRQERTRREIEALAASFPVP